MAVRAAAGQFVASAGGAALVGAATATASSIFAGWSWWTAKRNRDVRIASGGAAAPIDPIAVPDPQPGPNPQPNPQPNPGPFIPNPGPAPPQPGPQDPKTAPLAAKPTPCMLYQIKPGDTFFSLVEQAYGVKQNFQTYEIAQQVNAYPYNQRFWVAAPANEAKLWTQRISFNPGFGSVAQQRTGTTKGNQFAAIYFPCVVTKTDGGGVANDDGILDYCPQWSVSETQMAAVTGRVFPLMENLRGDADFDAARRKNGGQTAEDAGFSRQYYEDLALWLAAHSDAFGGITNDPKLVRPLPIGKCTIIGTDQKTLLARVKTYYANLFGDS